MSCSARLPVYTILVALVIPSKLYFGFLSLQGLVMMGLYLLGTVMALIVAWVMKWFIKSTERSYFILELPVYRGPRKRNILYILSLNCRCTETPGGKTFSLPWLRKQKYLYLMPERSSCWSVYCFGHSVAMARLKKWKQFLPGTTCWSKRIPPIPRK